jgi:cysteinyl-tRNA synthetase
MVRFHDTLTNRVRELVPREPGKVSIYACGPTVYDDPHLGHGRTALTYDILRRYLRWRGFEVTLVSNVTDIDDNIINRAAEEGTTEPELAGRFAEIYVNTMRAFGIEDPTHRPHATQYVAEMVDFVQALVDAGAAYVIPERGVYFDVSAYADYGRLVHRSPEELRESAQSRVGDDDRKDDPLDFALWKAAKPGEPTWPSPWGPGRPGWHIECVAMAMDILGEGFDIHGGGTDLAFPHHENERAECEGAGRVFAKHWIHSAMLNIGGEKMSKSLGNFTTLDGALASFGPRALRLAFLQAHYRSVVELGDEAMAGATGAVERIDALARRLTAAGLEPAGAMAEAVAARFTEVMDDDLGTPAALALAFEQISAANTALDAGDTVGATTAAGSAFAVLAVVGLAPAEQETDATIDALVAERQTARAAKDFARADAIRDELRDCGIEIEDTPAGPIWHRA